MDKRIKLAFVGGGSFKWAPRIIKDIMLKEDLQAIDFVLLDKNIDSAKVVLRLCERMNTELRMKHTFTVTCSEDEAFAGCDFVIICISTGGLDAMAHDLAIPEKYGIYHTVGDTCGPGGWSRNMRNIPVFNALADTIERLAPGAVVLNYTNPMAALTKAFYARTELKAVGLCHGLFENYYVLQSIFGLESEQQLKVRFGGVNHFFWMLDFCINGQDGYQLLQEKLDDPRTFYKLHTNVEGKSMYRSTLRLASELFATYGYLPYMGDRHTCEFLPHMIAGSKNHLAAYQIHRTSIDDRRAELQARREETERQADGLAPVEYKRSRETAADIVEAIALGKEFIDVINVPNVGQIANLPLGTIVETLGVINALGFTPLAAGELPEPILRLVRPHAENIDMIYQAATDGDFELALAALYNDPVCSHLDYADIRRMAEELLQANREWLPQFFR